MVGTFTRFAAAFTLALGCVAGAASAATYSFDFTKQSSGPRPTLDYMTGDLSLAVAGMDSTGESRRVETWQHAGLGVHVWNDSSHALDSEGPNDIAVFGFNQAVTIASISFGYTRQGSTFDLLYPDGSNIERLTRAVTSVVDFDLPEYMFSTHWGVMANDLMRDVCKGDHRSQCGYSEFKVTGLTVETIDMPPPPASVPLPATGLLLAAALGGFGMLRRKD